MKTNYKYAEILYNYIKQIVFILVKTFVLLRLRWPLVSSFVSVRIEFTFFLWSVQATSSKE